MFNSSREAQIQGQFDLVTFKIVEEGL